jgi:hypothetical protein
VTRQGRALIAIALIAVVAAAMFVFLREASARTVRLDGYQQTGDPRKIVVTATIGLAQEIVSAEAREDADSVTVTVRVRTSPGIYPAVGIHVPALVSLREPLADRIVRDHEGQAIRHLGTYRAEFRGPPSATDFIFFPVLASADAIPPALMQGRLLLRSGCLWMQPAEGRELYLALWPAGSRLEAAGSSVVVGDPSGARFSVGDRLRATGGETKDVEHVITLTGQKPPPVCQVGEGYWRMYQITRLP